MNETRTTKRPLILIAMIYLGVASAFGSGTEYRPSGPITVPSPTASPQQKAADLFQKGKQAADAQNFSAAAKFCASAACLPFWNRSAAFCCGLAVGDGTVIGPEGRYSVPEPKADATPRQIIAIRINGRLVVCVSFILSSFFEV